MVCCSPAVLDLSAQVLDEYFPEVEIYGNMPDLASVVSLLETDGSQVLVVDLDICSRKKAEVLQKYIAMYRTYVIAITSTMDESYACDLVNWGLSSLILKPVTREGLETALRKTLDASKKHSRTIKNKRDFKKWLSTIRPYLTLGLGCGIIYDLLSEQTSNELGLLWGVTERPVRVVFISPDNYNKLPSDASDANWDSMYSTQYIDHSLVHHLLQCLHGTEAQLFFPWGGVGIAIICPVPNNKDDYSFKKLIKILHTELSTLVSEITMGIGEPSQGPMGIKKSFQQALVAVHYRLIKGGNRIISFHDVQPALKELPLQVGLESSDIFNMHDPELGKLKLMAIIREAIKEAHNPDAVRTLSLQVLFWLTEKMNQQGIPYEESLKFLKQFLNLFLEVRTKDSFVNVFERAVNSFYDHLDQPCNALLVKALSVLESSRYSFGLQEVAAVVHVSPGHLSRLFKKEFGLSFNNYTHQKRMEMAARLLEQRTASVKDIAITLGYKDANYFTRVFTRTYGVSPSNYRV